MRGTWLLLLGLVGLLLGMLASGPSDAASLGRAARRGDAETVMRLLAAGEDPDEPDFFGNPPLYQAASKGHAEVVRLLAEAGADVDLGNRFGSTPLHAAAWAGHVDVIRALAAAGADLDARNLTGSARSQIAVGASAALNRETLRSATPLVKAARAGQLEAVRVLVELGAALPARDAVEEATLRGHEEIAAFLTRAASERPARERTAPAETGVALASAGPFEFTSDYRRKVAAVIGISRYAKMEDLEGARSDAAEVAELLRTLGFDAVYELYDEQATRPAILELLGVRLRAETGANDLAFVFFAGHGATETLPNGEKRGYLVPSEGDARDPYVTGISMESVADLSERLAARHVYYAIDACYSGGLVATPTEGVRGRPDAPNRSVQVLTAGLEGQQASESDGRGVFTTYLVQALRGEANRNGDAVVTATEIGFYVADQVGRATRGAQTPAFGRLGGNGEVRFGLAGSGGEER
ncbi:MAG: ankyrin repeat domain-containing protein [Myxococcales bacterium]|nr:ankyrin repeat domain-containing protein [Myxococcales bacterium]